MVDAVQRRRSRSTHAVSVWSSIGYSAHESRIAPQIQRSQHIGCRLTVLLGKVDAGILKSIPKAVLMDQSSDVLMVGGNDKVKMTRHDHAKVTHPG